MSVPLVDSEAVRVGACTDVPHAVAQVEAAVHLEYGPERGPGTTCKETPAMKATSDERNHKCQGQHVTDLLETVGGADVP